MTDPGTPDLRPLWDAARTALESAAGQFTVDAADPGVRAAIEELLGRRLQSDRPRIGLTRLRALAVDRFGLTLDEVLALVHDRPLGDAVRRPDAAEAHLRTALASAGLGSAPWAERWVTEVCRYGQIEPAALPGLAADAASVLARLRVDAPTTWIARGELAARFGGGAHGLDRGQPLARMVLRALAIATGSPSPRSAAEQRLLWERCGVALDSVSTTALCWALPVPGEIAARTARLRPTHLTLRDLADLPDPVVPPGTAVAVCENPRVLEAAIDAGSTRPMVCVTGQLTTVDRRLLTLLTEAGAAIRCHGDFDGAGLAIAGHVLALTGGKPWRMGAGDYRAALALADERGIDLPVLGEVPETVSWDDDLPAVLRSAGRAVEEEVVLDLLVGDLLTDQRRVTKGSPH